MPEGLNPDVFQRVSQKTIDDAIESNSPSALSNLIGDCPMCGCSKSVGIQDWICPSCQKRALEADGDFEAWWAEYRLGLGSGGTGMERQVAREAWEARGAPVPSLVEPGPSGGGTPPEIRSVASKRITAAGFDKDDLDIVWACYRQYYLPDDGGDVDGEERMFRAGWTAARSTPPDIGEIVENEYGYKFRVANHFPLNTGRINCTVTGMPQEPDNASRAMSDVIKKYEPVYAEPEVTTRPPGRGPFQRPIRTQTEIDVAREMIDRYRAGEDVQLPTKSPFLPFCDECGQVHPGMKDGTDACHFFGYAPPLNEKGEREGGPGWKSLPDYEPAFGPSFISFWSRVDIHGWEAIDARTWARAGWEARKNADGDVWMDSINAECGFLSKIWWLIPDRLPEAVDLIQERVDELGHPILDTRIPTKRQQAENVLQGLPSNTMPQDVLTSISPQIPHPIEGFGTYYGPQPHFDTVPPPADPPREVIVNWNILPGLRPTGTLDCDLAALVTSGLNTDVSTELAALQIQALRDLHWQLHCMNQNRFGNQWVYDATPSPEPSRPGSTSDPNPEITCSEPICSC